MADGSRHSLYMTPEATYGVTPDMPDFETVRHTGTTLALSKNTTQSEELRPDRQIADYRHGAYQIGGDISAEFSFGSFDTILEAACMGTWENDILKAGVERRSFSVMRHFSDMSSTDKPYHLFTGIEFNNLSLQIAPDAIVNATFTVLGKGVETLSSEPTDAEYQDVATGAVLDSFTGTLTESGSTIAVITEIQLNLENSLEARFVVGSKETIRPQVGRSNVSGQITAYFENSDLLDKFINETESSIEFTMPDNSGNQYTITLPRIKYNGGQPDVSGQGAITLSMPFQALYDDTAESNIVIERIIAS